MKIFTIPEAISKISETIQGSESRKNGQSRIELANMFGNSKSFFYEYGRESTPDQPPKAVIISDPEKNVSYLCRITHVAKTAI